ncbi:MAG TPA: hypothetical protein VGM74_08880 [Burkholderiaceae bacterium]|jgi:hypothetical protein
MIVDPIPEDEVFDRLRPVLRAQGLDLHRGPLDGMSRGEVGRFYTTKNGASGEVDERDLDLERRARALGVLRVNEAMVPSHGEPA